MRTFGKKRTVQPRPAFQPFNYDPAADDRREWEGTSKPLMGRDQFASSARAASVSAFVREVR